MFASVFYDLGDNQEIKILKHIIKKNKTHYLIKNQAMKPESAAQLFPSRCDLFSHPSSYSQNCKIFLSAYESVRWRKVKENLTPDGTLLKFMELALYETKHKARLANSRLPQKHQFKLADLIPSVWPVGSCCSSISHVQI